MVTNLGSLGTNTSYDFECRADGTLPARRKPLKANGSETAHRAHGRRDLLQIFVQWVLPAPARQGGFQILALAPMDQMDRESLNRLEISLDWTVILECLTLI
jgi:hypothetical protein